MTLPPGMIDKAKVIIFFIGILFLVNSRCFFISELSPYLMALIVENASTSATNQIIGTPTSNLKIPSLLSQNA